MASFFDSLDPELSEWLEAQPIYFVATSAPDARINLSPKGEDSLRVVDGSTVVYLDLTGSGNETAAHVRADGRITLMACSFDRSPRILRVYGRGETVRRSHPEFDELLARFPAAASTRQIVRIHVESVQTSCGYGVPVARELRQRNTLLAWGESKGSEGIFEYQREKNVTSIDGLPTGLFDD